MMVLLLCYFYAAAISFTGKKNNINLLLFSLTHESVLLQQ